MSEPIINKVAESGLITIDLEKWYPKEPSMVFDMKDHLFMGMILKEKAWAMMNFLDMTLISRQGQSKLKMES